MFLSVRPPPSPIDHGSLLVSPTQVKSGKIVKQPIPSDHARHLSYYHEADQKIIGDAIDGALAAKEEWETLPWNDRAAIFLKAAELASGKYRYKLMAATMLGQGKNAWQAEIDAAAEVECFLLFPPSHTYRIGFLQLSDFFRFGVKFVEELYSQQPPKNSPGAWK